jgi:TetR/AcrR family transcriptional regulator
MNRHNSKRTREALITAGTELFARHGFEGTRVNLIARKARVNKAMISYHFGGKAGLYRAILLSLFSSTLERVQPLRTSPLPADALLRSFVKIFSEMVARRPDMPMMLLREALSGGRHLDRETFPGFVAVFSVVREIIEKGTREHTFRPVDPLLTHLGLIGALVFFFATAPMRDRLIREGLLPFKAPEGDAFVSHVQDLMTRALAADLPRRASEARG